ncbi:MAG: DUF1801 domain-containing protein [Ornithinimicrobium sp.]
MTAPDVEPAPAITDPGLSEPAIHDPGLSEPGVPGPAITDPAAKDPAAKDPGVGAAFDSYDPSVAAMLLQLRQLIFHTAAETVGVGPIDETLKWGQPSYLTSQSRSGSTIRLAPAPANTGYDCAMYFICSTSLVDDFRAAFGELFAYEGNRALLFRVADTLPVEQLRECVAMALTYHLSTGRP